MRPLVYRPRNNWTDSKPFVGRVPDPRPTPSSALGRVKPRHSGATQAAKLSSGSSGYLLDARLALRRFVEYRFRPGIQLPEQDAREAYYNQAVHWKQHGLTPIPSFAEDRPKPDQALDRWLGDTLTQVEIRFHEGAFQ